jgi:hypothetical protein
LSEVFVKADTDLYGGTGDGGKRRGVDRSIDPVDQGESLSIDRSIDRSINNGRPSESVCFFCSVDPLVLQSLDSDRSTGANREREREEIDRSIPHFISVDRSIS